MLLNDIVNSFVDEPKIKDFSDSRQKLHRIKFEKSLDENHYHEPIPEKIEQTKMPTGPHAKNQNTWLTKVYDETKFKLYNKLELKQILEDDTNGYL